MKIIQTKKSVVMLFLLSTFFMCNAAEETPPFLLKRSPAVFSLKDLMVTTQPGVQMKNVRFKEPLRKQREKLTIVVVVPKIKEKNYFQKCYAESTCFQKTLCCGGTTLGISGLFAMMLFL